MRINNAYFPTWSENLDWDKGAGKSKLALVEECINYITLSFLRPDTEYNDINGPMNTLFYDGEIPLTRLKEEIKASKDNYPGNRVVLASTGGEIGGNFPKVNYDALVNGVSDLGLDGIDIDYEPNGVMTQSQTEIEKYIELISGFRKAFDKKTRETGKKYIISCAPTGIGLFGIDNEFRKQNIEDPLLNRFDKDNFGSLKSNIAEIIEKLKELVPEEEQEEELKIGSLDDSNILKQPQYNVGSVGSCYNFEASGKMIPVFLTRNNDLSLADYEYIGQMVDIVFYQAYNMGSGNVLSKILCYEAHRNLSDFFNRKRENSGFKIGHGSHIGMEAWPHFSYTKKRLSYIYNYIRQHGRNGDGASFWSYSSSHTDNSDNVPFYGMEYKSTIEIFEHVNLLLNSREK